MALRNQPYLPLYVQDYLTDEKLNLCSTSTQGVYIKIMCILHKQTNYGTLVLLKQNDKQNKNICSNFASTLARLLPFDYETILPALEELIEYDVLQIQDSILSQKRMVKDNALSEVRAKAGSKGGSFAQANAKAKTQANTEVVIVNENELLDYSIIEKELSNSEIWLSDISMNYKIDINLIRKHLSDFIKNQRVEKPGKRLLSDVRKHFNNTLRIKLSKQGCSTVKKERTYDELIAEREERLATNRKLADEKVAELSKSV